MSDFSRATFFITDNRFCWTETYYCTINSALKDVMSEAVSLAVKRVQLLASRNGDITQGPSLDYIRVSFDDTWRDSLINTKCKRDGGAVQYNRGLLSQYLGAPNKGGAAYITSLGLSPEMPYSTILLRLQSGTLYRRSLYLSGSPQEVTIDPPGPQPNLVLAFQDALLNFEQELANGKWGIKVMSREAGPGEEKPVMNPTPPQPNQQAVNFNPDNTATVSIPNHGFPAIDQFKDPPRVIIRGTKYDRPTRGVNGTHHYTIKDANTINLAPPVLPAEDVEDPPVYQRGGHARYLFYVVKTIDDVQPVSETHRKRGVRSLAPLGRSKRPRPIVG